MTRGEENPKTIRPHQFSLPSLLKDIAGIAITLAMLRYLLIPGDDVHVLPAIGMIFGIVVGISIHRIGEGAFIGCLGMTGFIYVVSYFAPLSR